MYRYLLFALISLSIYSVFAQKRVREYTLNQPEHNDYYFTTPAKENASATDIVAASMFFGAAVAIVAQSARSISYYYQKLDFNNGSFIKIEKR